MKFVSNSIIEELGNAGMRCAWWSLRHAKIKNKRELGWHQGKYFAYMFCLQKMGWATIEDLQLVKNPKSFLKSFYKGRWALFPSLKWNLVVIMEDKYFQKCLYSNQPENNPNLQKMMKKLCKKI